jgi:phage terminase large subunit
MIELGEYREQLEDLVWAEILRQRDIPDILSESMRVFPQQANFIESPGNKKALFCTRRSAKSFTAGLYLIYECLRTPRCNCLFLGLTRESSKGIIWKDILKVLNERYSLGGFTNEQALTMTFPNGSVIHVTGVDASQDEMNKLLGRKYKLVCIDEASMYSIDLKNLVYGVLDPSVTDLNGTICLMGTASNFPRGLFYDITIGKEGGWKIFQWTAHDNPYVARKWADKLAEIARDRPGYMQTPQFKQWYLNQWVIDDEKLVYKFDIAANVTSSIPRLSPLEWTFVLGVDTGWEDDSGFCLTGYHLNDPHLYVISSFKSPKMTFEDVGQKIQQYYRNSEHAPHRIIIDGANKQGVESMRSRSNIPFEYADKLDKETFIELCNSDLIEGKIKIINSQENRALIDEMASLVWVTDGDKIKYPKKEHPNLPNHLCDAFLYAWRCGYHYASRKAIVKTVKYSREWYEDQSNDIWEREREHIKTSERYQDWPDQGTLGDLG